MNGLAAACDEKEQAVRYYPWPDGCYPNFTIFSAAGPESSVPRPTTPKGVRPQANPEVDAMLNRKVEALEATVAELRGQLKEQAAQIQKVSAQLEMSKPATKVVVNEP
jgi:Tfp pilus assembly protein FimV